jgi:hypothetical protein
MLDDKILISLYYFIMLATTARRAECKC